MRFTFLAPALLLCALAAQAQTDPVTAAAAKEPGAVVKPSGLVFLSQRDGTGPSPGPTDTVKVNYRGTFPDGREFDSSYKRGEPIEFPLNGVIKCWTEGVQLMKVGGKASSAAPRPSPTANAAPAAWSPNATLLFEVELLGVKGE